MLLIETFKKGAQAGGGGVGRTMTFRLFSLLKQRHSVTAKNLQICFEPQLSTGKTYFIDVVSCPY